MSELEQAVERFCGAPVCSLRRFAGGDISGASLAQLADGRSVVVKSGAVVSVEAGMLRVMEESPAPSPRVIGCSGEVLVIEHLPSSGSIAEAWEGLAEALHGLRQLTSDQYGWHEDYALRHVQVENEPSTRWPEFWALRRLLCHCPHLPGELASRVEALAKALPDMLPDRPPPVFVHGDLWGGNVLVHESRVSGLIDPCACWGHQEVDAASLTVFDHPPDRFFDALDLEPGWRERQPVYRLWMWLLHVRLFGMSYAPAATRELGDLGF